MKHKLLCIFALLGLFSSCSVEKSAQYGYYLNWTKPSFNNDHRNNGQLPIVESSMIANKATSSIANVESVVVKNDIKHVIPAEIIGSYGMSAPNQSDLVLYESHVKEVSTNPIVDQGNRSFSTESEDISEPLDDEVIIAAILCWFLGMFGAHWFYLGKNAKGKTRLLLTLLSVASVYGGVFVTYLLSPYLGILMIYGGYLFLLFLFAMNIIDLVNILQGKY